MDERETRVCVEMGKSGKGDLRWLEDIDALLLDHLHPKHLLLLVIGDQLGGQNL